MTTDRRDLTSRVPLRDDLAFSVVPLGHDRGRAILDRWDAMQAALEEIAEHVVVGDDEFPDDNCDWHCTLTMQARAKDALNA